MSLQATYQKYTLRFKFEAGTSRGVLTERDTYFIKIFDDKQPACFGLGEASPLKGLSLDDLPDFEDRLQKVCRQFSASPDLPDDAVLLEEWIGNALPAIQFGFETALTDWRNGGQRMLFPGPFTRGEKAIPINGLVWMGDETFMRSQLEEKLAQGYTCLKMKISNLHFDTECKLLASVRQHFPADQITLRVDANGAFSAAEAMEKLKQLAQFELHSIEQPIKPGQPEQMARLCGQSPVPVALDEELIGVSDFRAKKALLQSVQPPYIILKPTLLGGFRHCREWIELANQLGIGWWITSALESNVGLNAISQFTASLQPVLPQGLGTGQLYHNNIASPLEIKKGFLSYNSLQAWGK